jgi:hypothetical protein
MDVTSCDRYPAYVPWLTQGDLLLNGKHRPVRNWRQGKQQRCAMGGRIREKIKKDSITSSPVNQVNGKI